MMTSIMSLIEKRVWSSLVLAAVLFLPSSQARPNTRGAILSSFFQTCNGDLWKQNTGWFEDGTHFCSWFGVRCNAEGRMVELDLRNNGLICEVPNYLFYLPKLTSLDLSGNVGVSLKFKSLDPFLAADIKRIFFAGTNTTSLDGIVTFRNLETLSASDNKLTGSFPEQLKNLPHLKNLDLSHNFLNGTIPEDIHVLSKLQLLLINNNHFSGTLTSNIGKLADLTQLSLEFNDMEGTLPVELMQLVNLTLLSVNDQVMNKGTGFTGPMLDFAVSPFLLSVDVSNNALTGTIPGSLLKSVKVNFSNLVSVDMSGNRLTGVIPAGLSRFEAIRIFLSDNRIKGIDPILCSKFEWFFGDVGEFGCDGILCPPRSYNIFGRQISTVFPCDPCPSSIFFGATTCVPTDTIHISNPHFEQPIRTNASDTIHISNSHFEQPIRTNASDVNVTANDDK